MSMKTSKEIKKEKEVKAKAKHDKQVAKTELHKKKKQEAEVKKVAKAKNKKAEHAAKVKAKETAKIEAKKKAKPSVLKKKPVKKVVRVKKDLTYKQYHVSFSKIHRGWCVRAAGSTKALRVFDTQAEAIEYAKYVSENQDGSIRVHSLKGRIRKK